MFDQQAYLTRIGYEGSVDPSAETLRWLHRAHVLTVPFENLDIHLGRSISLDPSDLFQKIVLSRRGGYCFELNGLFALLLEQLGFSVTRLAARVLYGAEGARPRSHQLLLVQIGESRWMTDVGFGGNGLREPFPLTAGHEQQQGPDRFQLVIAERGEHMLQCDIEGAWENLYSFTLDPCLPVDYIFANYYHSHSPDSPFTQRRICTIPTLQGRKMLTDRLLKIHENGTTEELHVKDDAECKQQLQQHFKLTIKDHFILFWMDSQ